MDIKSYCLKLLLKMLSVVQKSTCCVHRVHMPHKHICVLTVFPQLDMNCSETITLLYIYIFNFYQSMYGCHINFIYLLIVYNIFFSCMYFEVRLPVRVGGKYLPNKHILQRIYIYLSYYDFFYYAIHLQYYIFFVL